MRGQVRAQRQGWDPRPCRVSQEDFGAAVLDVLVRNRATRCFLVNIGADDGVLDDPLWPTLKFYNCSGVTESARAHSYYSSKQVEEQG